MELASISYSLLGIITAGLLRTGENMVRRKRAQFVSPSHYPSHKILRKVLSRPRNDGTKYFSGQDAKTRPISLRTLEI